MGHAMTTALAATAPMAGVGALDAAAARAFLHRANRIIGRHAAALTRLDAALGDGDHGDNLVAGLAAVVDELERDGHPDGAAGGEGELASLLQSSGTTLVAGVGGASGPLYGAALVEAGWAARRIDGLRPVAGLAMLLDSAAAALARRGHCAVGDKTIFDTLAPAAAALRAALESGADDAAALRAMIAAGAAGMRSTTGLVARRGLALRLGDRSRGHRDPGAVSCMLILCALAAGGSRGR